MITKELLKSEIDFVQDSYLELLYNLVKILERIPGDESLKSNNFIENINMQDKKLDWDSFIEETSGCLSDSSIQRGDQGDYEIREVIK